jgi:hypothetical protein
MTRADVDAILGPRFTWREEIETRTLHVCTPADLTQDDHDRLAELEKRKPLTVAIRIKDGPYR